MPWPLELAIIAFYASQSIVAFNASVTRPINIHFRCFPLLCFHSIIPFISSSSSFPLLFTWPKQILKSMIFLSFSLFLTFLLCHSFSYPQPLSLESTTQNIYTVLFLTLPSTIIALISQSKNPTNFASLQKRKNQLRDLVLYTTRFLKNPKLVKVFTLLNAVWSEILEAARATMDKAICN